MVQFLSNMKRGSNFHLHFWPDFVGLLRTFTRFLVLASAARVAFLTLLFIVAWNGVRRYEEARELVQWLGVLIILYALFELFSIYRWTSKKRTIEFQLDDDEVDRVEQMISNTSNRL